MWAPNGVGTKTRAGHKRGKPAKQTAYERRIVRLLARMDKRQRELLLGMARRMVSR